MNLSRLTAGLLALASFAFASIAEAKSPASSVGMEQVTAPVSGDVPVPVTIWYPSTSAAHPQPSAPTNSMSPWRELP
jgi:hypothetical protein